MKELTVRDLRHALAGVPDDLPVRLGSDTGVDQGDGNIIIEEAGRVKNHDIDYFEIYANDHYADTPDCEPLPDEDFNKIMNLLKGRWE